MKKMPRRKTKHITDIKGTGTEDYSVVWRVFECPRVGCYQLLRISEDDITECWKCTEEVKNATKNFIKEYYRRKPRYDDLIETILEECIQSRKSHSEKIPVIKCPKCGQKIYIDDEFLKATKNSRWKYCRVCEWLQPLENFGFHKPNTGGFRSGRQLECKICKNTKINPFLNPLRTSDQHREAAQRRRLYGILSGEPEKIDSKKIFEKFEGKCFNCGKRIEFKNGKIISGALDHTIPARYLWPLTTKNATLLCDECNNKKHDKWPSEFYNKKKLRKLAVLTGIPFDLLEGPPRLNPNALKKILANVDKFIEDWIEYPEDIKRIRNLILELERIDIFKRAKHVPDYLKEE